jgi:hypothetical protein
MRLFCALGGSFVALALPLALALTPGCGGDDDGDGEGTEADGGLADAGPDGGGTSGDAAIGDAGPLGTPCQSEEQCPDESPVCLSLSQGASSGICTMPCATTPAPPDGMEPMPPPAEASQICLEAHPGPARAGCSAPLPPDSGEVQWLCVLACGMTKTEDFGDCPDALVCDQPDPESNGFCVPPG